MKKRIDIHGQRVELYSSDQGRTWSSNPQLIAAYGQREEILRLELKERFARIDQMQEPDPYGDFSLEVPNRFSGK
jgi:hypothetical protein